MATMTCEQCWSVQRSTLNYLTVISASSGYSLYGAFYHNWQCKPTYVLKIASLSMEGGKMRHTVRDEWIMSVLYLGEIPFVWNSSLRLAYPSAGVIVNLITWWNKRVFISEISNISGERLNSHVVEFMLPRILLFALTKPSFYITL